MSEYESYQGNSCNSHGKHAQQKYHGENKFNFVSRKEISGTKNIIKAEIIEWKWFQRNGDICFLV